MMLVSQTQIITLPTTFNTKARFYHPHPSIPHHPSVFLNMCRRVLHQKLAISCGQREFPFMHALTGRWSISFFFCFLPPWHFQVIVPRLDDFLLLKLDPHHSYWGKKKKSTKPCPHMFVTNQFQLGLMRCLLYFFGIESQRRCLWSYD